MFRIPDDLLDKLKCSICAGYLNRSPVVVKNGFQICARCYTILPQKEKEQCVRQISFEALGKCLLFPCRYHQMGCSYTFTFDSETDHELTCDKKHFTYPNSSKVNKKQTEDFISLIDLSTYSETISQEYECQLFQQNQSKINCEEISKSKEQHFTEKCISDQQPILQTELNNNYVVSSADYENMYESISVYDSPKTLKKCLNCSYWIDNNVAKPCLFGHILCKTCQGDMCVACVKNLDGNSKVACKNAPRGCNKLLLQGDASHHRDNCEFNEIKCPVENCATKEIMEKLMQHLQQTHQDDIISNNELSKTMNHKDKTFIFLCYDGIFKCSYYYFESYVELCVIYIGPCERAAGFSFEVSVGVDKKIIRKEMECANWNNSMLDKCISFTRKELIGDGKKCTFVLNLKITKITK